MTRELVNRRGKKITVTLSDEEMFAEFVRLHLAGRIPRNEFSGSLLTQARSQKGSPEQRWWMHEMVLTASGQVASGEKVGVLTRVAVMVKKASESRDPMIKLVVNDFHRIGIFGKLPARVCRREKNDDGWSLIGRLYPDGSLIQSDKARFQEDELRVLANYELDPEKSSREHGLTHGWCCFCGLALTADNSLQVGYGPVCADKYGLPWGPLPRREKVE